jgi:hypothetical protein
MALAAKSRAVSVAFGTFSFFLADGDTTVRVDVSRDVLARLGHAAPNCTRECVQRLQRYRSKFAQIAAAKYDEGEFESEVNVLVVRIATDDLQQS